MQTPSFSDNPGFSAVIDSTVSGGRDSEETFDALFEELKKEATLHLGYPCNQTFDYSSLWRFLEFSINNVGDPFLTSNFKLNTHAIECRVVNWFADLFSNGRARDIWGYVTNGGTEGNMYGLYLARELHPEGMVYYSEDTHYSVSKILRQLRCRSIMIKSQPNGEMDYDDFRETVRIHRDTTPIVVANLGTTMKGAVDDVRRINGILDDLAVPARYVHADAALSGMILPFLDTPEPYGLDEGIDSTSVSGHKMIGSPFPCGVALAKKDNVDLIARSIEYIGTLDTTLSGSRNGIAPLFLWSAILKAGVSGFTRISQDCVEMADYAIEQMKETGAEAWRNPNSITVVFPRPSDTLIERWQLATHRDVSHIITMPHVTKEQIERFARDYAADREGAEPKQTP